MFYGWATTASVKCHQDLHENPESLARVMPPIVKGTASSGNFTYPAPKEQLAGKLQFWGWLIVCKSSPAVIVRIKHNFLIAQKLWLLYLVGNFPLSADKP